MTNAIVLTGGATGIGYAVLQSLQDSGNRLYNLDIKPCELEGVTNIVCDLSDTVSIDAALDALPETVQGLAHIAGVAPMMVSDLQIMKVNFLGMRYLNEALLPRMNHQGRIVIVASSIGRDWQDNNEAITALFDQTTFDAGTAWLETNENRWTDNPYKFSKQCAAAYTYHAAGIARTQQVAVNCVNPGIVETQLSPWFRDLVGAEFYDQVIEQTGRPGRPDDIAGVVCFLLSDESRWVNGVEISVDGGYRAGVVGGWLS